MSEKSGELKLQVYQAGLKVKSSFLEPQRRLS